MNLSKAREYFSAYYEGAIDRGLKEGFERLLRQDAQIQAEYRAFESTMRQLEAMPTIQPSVPDDLHERIVARIDRHAWESKQSRRSGGFSWWKSAVLIGAAATVLGIAIFNGGRGSAVNEAGIAGSLGQSRLDIHADEWGVRLDYQASGSHTVIIKDADGNILEKLELKNQAIKGKSLSSGSPRAALVGVSIDNVDTAWIALPGTERDAGKSGEGTLKELAIMIADSAGVPVVMQVSNPGATVSWKFDDRPIDAIAQAALKPLGKKVELRPGRSDAGTLWILND